MKQPRPNLHVVAGGRDGPVSYDAYRRVKAERDQFKKLAQDGDRRADRMSLILALVVGALPVELAHKIKCAPGLDMDFGTISDMEFGAFVQRIKTALGIS